MTRKLKIMTISGRLLLDLLKGEQNFMAVGLPKDAGFQGWKNDLYSMPDMMIVYISSKTFPDVPEGAMVPPLVPAVTVKKINPKK